MSTATVPITVISLTGFPKPAVPAPHKLYTPETFPNLLPTDSPIYLVLPSVPYTALSATQTQAILRLLTLAPKRLLLFFPDPIIEPDVVAYEILFNARAVTSYSARILLSTLPSLNAQPLSIKLFSNTIHDFLLSPPPEFDQTLPNTASIVALGASPPTIHTLNSMAGFRLSFVPHSAQPSLFLEQLQETSKTALLRFPGNSHFFLYFEKEVWHGLLLSHFPTGLVPLINPVSITRKLRNQPRVPVHRPILHLPEYHSPESNVQSFESAIQTVAHRRYEEGKPRPPTIAEIIELDKIILRHRIKRKQKVNELKPVVRLVPKNQSNRITKPVKQSVKTAARKRSRACYFHSMLSSILPKDYTFFSSHHPRLSWKRPDERLIQNDPKECYGTHAVEFCDEQHDLNITECERLIGKSVFEFSNNKVSSRDVRLLKRALAHLRAKIGEDEHYRKKALKRAESSLEKSCGVLDDKTSSATVATESMFVSLPLPSQIKV